MSVLVPLLALLVSPASAREGLFIRAGMGTGGVLATGDLGGVSHAIVAKNHSLGYGITDRLSLEVGETGGLVRKTVGPYDYVNLNGVGLGATVWLPNNVLIRTLGGYGSVSLDEKWWQLSGTNKEHGFAASISPRKEWLLSGHFSVGVGAQLWLVASKHYQFTGLSADVSLAFYLKSAAAR